MGRHPSRRDSLDRRGRKPVDQETPYGTRGTAIGTPTVANEGKRIVDLWFPVTGARAVILVRNQACSMGKAL